MVGDFTRDIVMSSLGVTRIGFTMSIFGGVSVFAALSMGALSDFIGRVPVFIIGALVEAAALLFLLQWHMYV